MGYVMSGAVTGGPSTISKEDRSGFAEAWARFADANEGLDVAITQLADRLEPVLIPQPPPTPTPSGALVSSGMPISEITTVLRGRVESIVNMTRKLDSLRLRLDL